MIRSYQDLALSVPEYEDAKIYQRRVFNLFWRTNDVPGVYAAHMVIMLDQYKTDNGEASDIYSVDNLILKGVMTEKENVYMARSTMDRLNPVIRAEMERFFDGETERPDAWVLDSNYKGGNVERWVSESQSLEKEFTKGYEDRSDKEFFRILDRLPEPRSNVVEFMKARA